MDRPLKVRNENLTIRRSVLNVGFKAKFIIENKSEELHEAKVVETEAFVHRRRNEAY